MKGILILAAVVAAVVFLGWIEAVSLGLSRPAFYIAAGVTVFLSSIGALIGLWLRKQGRKRPDK